MAKKPPSRRNGRQGDYEIGFGRPPARTRFKPGQSGNPKGRPPGRLDPSTVLTRIMSELIPVGIDGRKTKKPALEVLLLNYRNRALQGDEKAATAVISWLRSAHRDASQPGDETPEFALDEVTLKKLLERLHEDISSGRQLAGGHERANRRKKP